MWCHSRFRLRPVPMQAAGDPTPRAISTRVARSFKVVRLMRNSMRLRAAAFLLPASARQRPRIARGDDHVTAKTEDNRSAPQHQALSKTKPIISALRERSALHQLTDCFSASLSEDRLPASAAACRRQEFQIPLARRNRTMTCRWRICKHTQSRVTLSDAGFSIRACVSAQVCRAKRLSQFANAIAGFGGWIA